jgi:uncharacterized protein (TIGR03067 family)
LITLGLAAGLCAAPDRGLLGRTDTTCQSTTWDQVEGTWEVVEYVRGDSAYKVLPNEDMTGTVTIDGDRFRFTIESLGQVDQRLSATADIDYAKSTMDLTFTNGPNRGQTATGIFELNGDELRICFPISDSFGDRPTEFAAAPGSNFGLFVLRRLEQ